MSIFTISSRIPTKYKILLLILCILYFLYTCVSVYHNLPQLLKIYSQLINNNKQISQSINNNYSKNIQGINSHEQNQFNQDLQEWDDNLKSNQNYQPTKNNQKYYNYVVPNRTSLGQASMPQSKLLFWSISKIRPQQQLQKHKNIDVSTYNKDRNSYSCVFVNSINIFTKITSKSINIMVKNEEFKQVVIAIDAQDVKGSEMIQEQFKSYNINKIQVQFDSEYMFIRSVVNKCRNLVYIFGNFVIDQKMANIIESQSKSIQQFSLAYSQSYIDKNNKQITLTNLIHNNLQSITTQQFYRYLYIFDTRYLSLITPLSFSFYAKYTLEQMFLFPILSILQSYPEKLKPITYSTHSLVSTLVFQQHKQFVLKQSGNIKNDARKRDSFCFVSYPNNPQILNVSDALNYINAIENIQRNSANLGGSDKIYLIIYVPYRFGDQKLYEIFKELWKFMQDNKDFIVRFRIRANRTVSSLSAYESAYTYCPRKSVIISTRHNIVSFAKNFLTRLSYSLSQRFHYYYINTINQHKNTVSLDKMPKFTYNRTTRTVRKTSLYKQKFLHIQIFRSDLLKSIVFWMLKTKELQFYETQTSFITLMMQAIKLNFYLINETLVNIKGRQMTMKEHQEIENVKKYAQFFPLPMGILVPYRYNCLQNPAFRRHAPDKIQKNIHQIWIGSNNISKFRWKLHETVKNKNLEFNIYFWTLQNITKQIAPLTYPLVAKILEYNKQYETSLLAMAADLFRYEIVYRLGGFYVDFKFEALKPINQFVKYEAVFIDYDVAEIRLGSPRAIGIGIMGAMKNNYHLGYLLTEILNQNNLKINKQVNVNTGGFKVRRTFNQNELFHYVGLGYHFFVPLPGEKSFSECGGYNKIFDADQEVFQVPDINSSKIIKFGIPCKAYPQAYFSLYAPLARTWVRNKNIIN